MNFLFSPLLKEQILKAPKMKKTVVILIGAFAFSCGETTSNRSHEEPIETENNASDVEEFSGEHITPQIEADSVSSRLEVDTISSAAGAEDAVD